jgi:hypothetical protein
MAVRVGGRAFVVSLCVLYGSGVAVAQSPAEAPDARAICDSIDTTTARPAALAAGQARGESDPLVLTAAGLMAQPSRQAVLAAIGRLEQPTTNDPSNAVAWVTH